MDWPKWTKRKETNMIVRDEQSGKVFWKEEEAVVDIISATVSIIYLIAMMIFISWLCLDLFIGRKILISWISDDTTQFQNDLLIRMMSFAILGGAFGGVIQGIRSIIYWHPELKAFGWRFIWKYITLPMVGAILGAVVYAIMRVGVAGIEGNLNVNGDPTAQGLTAFSIGTLSGYASYKVFIWLRHIANKIFKVPSSDLVVIPDLTGKSESDAEESLRKLKLKIGQVNRQQKDGVAAGKIFSQNPMAGYELTEGGVVDITVAT
jgi:hypothetical protein